METGSLIVYHGNGIGKTSAAIGAAMKCATNGGTAYLVQFMKGHLDSNLYDRLEPEIKVFRFEHSLESFSELTDEERQEERQNYHTGLFFAKKVLTTGECDLLVLDEVLGLIEEDLVTSGEVLEVLKARSMFTTIILTGTNLPDAIRVAADHVYNITTEK